MSKFSDTMKTIRSVREKTDTAVLFYSAGGKDSIALLHMLATTFPKVICYYMYVVPNLQHIQPYIKWTERYGNVEVRQIEHYQLDAIRKLGIFCIPEPDRKVRKVGEVEQMVRDETGQTYVFSGMKGVDGFMKRMRLKMWAKDGYINPKGMVYPLAIWTNKEVLSYISQNNLIKPFVYTAGNISQGFGVDYDSVSFLKEHYPHDFELMKLYFPYIDNLFIDHERKQSIAAGNEDCPA